MLRDAKPVAFGLVAEVAESMSARLLSARARLGAHAEQEQKGLEPKELFEGWKGGLGRVSFCRTWTDSGGETC